MPILLVRNLGSEMVSKFPRDTQLVSKCRTWEGNPRGLAVNLALKRVWHALRIGLDSS